MIYQMRRFLAISLQSTSAEFNPLMLQANQHFSLPRSLAVIYGWQEVL